MKSSELSNGENYDNFCKTGNDVIYDVIIWVQDGNCKKWLEIILVLVRSTIWKSLFHQIENPVANKREKRT